jgi:MFS family permease
MVIVGDVVDLKDRGKYNGMIGVFVVLSNSIGPFLGGVFKEKLSCKSEIVQCEVTGAGLTLWMSLQGDGVS